MSKIDKLEKFIFESRPFDRKHSINGYVILARDKYEAVVTLISLVNNPSVELASSTEWTVRHECGDMSEDMLCYWNELCIWAAK